MLSLKACQFKQMLTWPVSRIRVLKSLSNLCTWGVLDHSQLSYLSLNVKISDCLLGIM